MVYNRLNSLRSDYLFLKSRKSHNEGLDITKNLIIRNKNEAILLLLMNTTSDYCNAN